MVGTRREQPDVVSTDFSFLTEIKLSLKTPTTALSLSLKRNVSYMSAKENNFTRLKAAWNLTWFI